MNTSVLAWFATRRADFSARNWTAVTQKYRLKSGFIVLLNRNNKDTLQEKRPQILPKARIISQINFAREKKVESIQILEGCYIL